MEHIISVNGKTPVLGENCFLAQNSLVIGDVIAGRSCSFWFNVVVRGDVHSIEMGDLVNIQDGAIIHCTYKKAPTKIGNRVSIGHNAIVHGCTLEDDVLVGMGAVVMDHAVIGKGAVIAAGSVVLQNTKVEPGSIYAGVPAKKVKATGPEHEDLIQRTAYNYVKYASWFDKGIELEDKD